jgi:hypothetical protein
MTSRLRAGLLEGGRDVGGPVSFQLACYPGGGARYGARMRFRRLSVQAPDSCAQGVRGASPRTRCSCLHHSGVQLSWDLHLNIAML